jgi:hypothetical protein
MSLFAESLVEEWLNRKGFFTIRGIKKGVEEMDLLAVRPQNNGVPIGWHVEVQIGFRPVGFIGKRSKEMIAHLGGSPTSAKERSQSEIEVCAREWVCNKFLDPAKAKLRKEIWPDAEWSFHLVHGTVRESQELELFKTENVTCHPFHEILKSLSIRSNHSYSCASGGDFAEIVNYYQSFEEQKITGNNPPAKTPKRTLANKENHSWTREEDIAALYLQKFGLEYLRASLNDVAISLNLPIGTLKMRMANFKAIMGLGGLSQYSKQSKRVFEEYKNYSEELLRKKAFPINIVK